MEPKVSKIVDEPKLNSVVDCPFDVNQSYTEYFYNIWIFQSIWNEKKNRIFC